MAEMMEKKYLKTDIIGHCSRIEYGKAGDEVVVIDERAGMSLVEKGDSRFFVLNTELTDNNTIKADEIRERSVDADVSIPKPKNTKKKNKTGMQTGTSQQTLF